MQSHKYSPKKARSAYVLTAAICYDVASSTWESIIHSLFPYVMYNLLDFQILFQALSNFIFPPTRTRIHVDYHDSNNSFHISTNYFTLEWHEWLNPKICFYFQARCDRIPKHILTLPNSFLQHVSSGTHCESICAKEAHRDLKSPWKDFYFVAWSYLLRLNIFRC